MLSRDDQSEPHPGDKRANSDTGATDRSSSGEELATG